MEKRSRGQFSSNLLALELQIRTLFEEAGGKSALELLDTLCQVTPSEQKIALALFQRVLQKLLSGEVKLSSQQDQSMQELEDTLYREILVSMRGAATNGSGQMKLEVMRGGRHPLGRSDGSSSAVVQMEELRKLRANKPTMN